MEKQPYEFDIERYSEEAYGQGDGSNYTVMVWRDDDENQHVGTRHTLTKWGARWAARRIARQDKRDRKRQNALPISGKFKV